MRVVVLGAGRVGQAIALDLAASGFAVAATDSDPMALAPLAARGLATVRADLADRDAVVQLVAEFDLVVGALPAALGYRTVEAVIDAGRAIVDISFFEEDPFGLDALARERGVVAVVDAGVAPGLSNIIYGHFAAGADRVRRLVCYVGGLPAEPSGLMRYKAPFSPADVIELYTRPARYRTGGVLTTVPALSEITSLDVPGVGSLEAFLTDGLRSLLREDHVPEMREMTLRYPGHVQQMLLLREIGLLSTAPLTVGSTRISPRAVVTTLLFPLWEFAPGEPDLTVLHVEIDVEQGGSAERHTFDLLDRHDAESGTSSMARTTGYTCTAIVQLVADGTYGRTGVSAPEDVGRVEGCFDRVRSYLEARGVRLTETRSPLPPA
ncbi:MAG: saccharopine dehydrogenase NADP-binding domain-containing protein [Gemmatimonadota bacterium]|nr:saccharopine dehydrogenase NADP-binding domain-containing protein [Gemmatimonadota bacterium]MDH3367660.1 saccharopine dehydrogenase NADP-binding domain-containing protein [Gemmatimonadota bacterium]MDH3476670.1 saccharopine dehydrogenase NADP-binding domain-containing protein [Gemmatimonadota bacterium]